MMRGTEFGRKKKILALLAPAVCVSGLAVSGCARSRDVAVTRPEPAADQPVDADAAQGRRELIARDDAADRAASEADARPSGWRRWLRGGSRQKTEVAQETPPARRSFARLFADDSTQESPESNDPFLKQQSVQTASATEAGPTGIPPQSEPPVQTAQAEVPSNATAAAPAGQPEASREIWDSLMGPPNVAEAATAHRGRDFLPGESSGARPFPQEGVSRTDRLRAEVAATDAVPNPRPTPHVTETGFSSADQEQARQRVRRLVAQAYRQEAAGDVTGAVRSLDRAIELANYRGLTFSSEEDDPRNLKRRVEYGLRLMQRQKAETTTSGGFGTVAGSTAAPTWPSPARPGDQGGESLADEVFDDVFGQHQWRRADEPAPPAGADDLTVPPQTEPASGATGTARPFPVELPADPLSAQAEPETDGAVVDLAAEVNDSPIQLAGIVDDEETENVVRHAVAEHTDTESLRRVQMISEESVSLTSPLLAEGNYPEFPSRTESPAPEPQATRDPQPLYVAPPPPVETSADRSSRADSAAGAAPHERRSGRTPLVQIVLVLAGIAGGLALLFRRRGQKTPTAT